MSFFIRGKNSVNLKKPEKNLKRKHVVRKKPKKEADDADEQVATKKARDEDEEISSESDEEQVVQQNGHAAEPSSDEEERETAQEKRIRLAKKYLEEIERQEQERAESKDIDREAIGKRIKDDMLEQAGKLRRQVADEYVGIDEDNIKQLKCKEHNASITSIAVSLNGLFLYSASKDSSIVKWCLKEYKKIKSIPGGRKGTNHKGHTATVNCIAVSSDNKFLASGDDSGLIFIWEAETMDLLKTFRHQGAVTGVVFRRDTHQLYSSSKDRSVKIWSLDEMAYIESLFGHQCVVTSIDALARERAISSGGRDNSLRIWKIVEESQLIYNGHKGSIDIVKLISEEHFLSSGDDGTLCLWGSMKKKPLAFVENAHGLNSENNQPNWISSIASYLNTDLVASGSNDNYLRLWKCGESFKSLTPSLAIPVIGFVNAISFTPDGSHIIIGVGQEHRLGRWWRIKEARNSIFVIPLVKKTESTNKE